MNGRYSDFEELRPTGEASHVPDTRLEHGCDGEPRRQRVATSAGGYPDAPTTTDDECRSCGASVPDGQPKCRFCLTNHLGSDATSTDETASTTFLGIVHLIAESATFYGAVAKGGAAATLLSANEAELAVDDYTLIYDLDGAPARQLAEQWPSLPDAVQTSSKEGAQLLSAAHGRTGWHGQEASERQEQAPTRLYDQRGTGIREETRLKAIVDEANDELLLVPAIALTAATGERGPESPPSPVPTTKRLNCPDCGRVTDHQFETHDSIPGEMWMGQPIWECQRCGTVRYGPAPK